MQKISSNLSVNKVRMVLIFFMRSPPVNKNELISSMASEAGLTKADAGKALDAFISSITTALKGGNEVRLVGFGTFAVSKRAATTGRNPRTGETIKIKARKQAKFKAGKTLQDAVN
jgi:DNA-binding protein HU-beta